MLAFILGMFTGLILEMLIICLLCLISINR